MFRGGSPESQDPFAGTPSCPNRLKSWWSWCGAPRAVPVSLTPSSAAGRKVPGPGSHFQRRLPCSGSGRDAPRAPRTLSPFPRPAQELDLLETPCLPWRERWRRRMVTLKPEAPPPLPGPPCGWRGERVAAGLRDTEVCPAPGGQFPQKGCGRLSRGHLTRLYAIGVWPDFKGRGVPCKVEWPIPKAVLLFMF